jgi:hypothetical protein
MEVDVWMFLEPAIALLMGVEIIEDDVQLAGREGGNHAVHEAEELDTAPPLGMLGNNPAAGDFERLPIIHSKACHHALIELSRPSSRRRERMIVHAGFRPRRRRTASATISETDRLNPSPWRCA